MMLFKLFVYHREFLIYTYHFNDLFDYLIPRRYRFELFSQLLQGSEIHHVTARKLIQSVSSFQPKMPLAIN